MNAVVMTKVVEFLCLSLRHLEPERILVSNHDAEHKNGHEAARLQAVGREICADHRHERHDRRIFRKKGPTFVGNEKCGQITKRGADNDPDHRLLEQIEQRRRNRKLAGAHGHRQHRKRNYRASGIIECRLTHDRLSDAVANFDLSEDGDQRCRVCRCNRRSQQKRHDPGNTKNAMRGECGYRRSDQNPHVSPERQS